MVSENAPILQVKSLLPMTLEKLSEESGVSIETLQEWARCKIMPAHKPGGKMWLVFPLEIADPKNWNFQDKPNPASQEPTAKPKAKSGKPKAPPVARIPFPRNRKQ